MTSAVDVPAQQLQATVALGRRFDLVVVLGRPDAAVALVKGFSSVEPGRGWLPLRTLHDLHAFPRSLLTDGRPWVWVDGGGRGRRLVVVTVDPSLELSELDELGEAMGRLNRARNRLFELEGVLVLAGGEELFRLFTERASDTWSVRSLVLAVHESTE